MNSSTSAFFQKNLVRTQQAMPSFNNQNSMVKTSNPVIFPSLHPMSAFYKQKQNVRPNNKVPAANDIQGLYKKVKQNNGAQKIVKDFNNSIATKTITKEIKQETPNNLAQSPFRVPKLPSRLNSPDNNQLIMTQVPQDIGTTSDPLVVPDNVKLEWEMPEPIKSQPLLQNSQLARLPNSAVNVQVLNRIYENLKLEFFAFQLKQNMIKAQQQQQRQQESLRQSLKQLLMTNSSPEKMTFNQRDRKQSIETDTSSIKEEHIKQEVTF